MEVNGSDAFFSPQPEWKLYSDRLPLIMNSTQIVQVPCSQFTEDYPLQG